MAALCGDSRNELFNGIVPTRLTSVLNLSSTSNHDFCKPILPESSNFPLSRILLSAVTCNGRISAFDIYHSKLDIGLS